MVWGSADYCGGRATRDAPAVGDGLARSPAVTVTVVSQLLGLPVVALSLILIPGTPGGTDLAWGAASGVAGFLGLVMLYRSLSTGAMAVAAPTTAVTAAVVPIVAGLLLGEQPSALAFAGVACAVVAIGLVSMGQSTGQAGALQPRGRATAGIVGLALGSGAMFGFFFVLLAQTADEAGMWPLASARVASITLGSLLLLGGRTSFRMPRRILGWLVLTGCGDIAANALYLIAVREGLLSVVAPIASLYPVSTVLLALAVDREHVRPVQIAGLGLAATALVLTAV